MKDNRSLTYKYLLFNKNWHFSNPITVTIFPAVIFCTDFGSNYHIGNVAAQSANTSSISELTDKGNSLFYLGKYEEAITWYDKALEVYPNYTNALYDKGTALAYLGRHQEAITWYDKYDKALALDPNDLYTLYNKGAALNDLGRHQEAIT